jgi:hypothetical protein
MKVNGHEAEPGCFIAGHHGQYGIDMLADVAEQFGIELNDDDDPRFWRRAAEAETAEDAAVISNGPGRIGSHLARPDECWDRHHEAGDKIEELLNERTEGGYWTWTDGEFFLVQTEVTGFIYVRVDDGEDYDDAWRLLTEHGLAAALNDYDALEKGERAYMFETTVRYAPDEQPEQWTPHEIALGLDN